MTIMVIIRMMIFRKRTREQRECIIDVLPDGYGYCCLATSVTTRAMSNSLGRD